MEKHKTLERRDPEELRLAAQKIDRFSSLFDTIVRWGVAAFIVYCITDAIKAFAGQVTVLELRALASVLLKQNIDRLILLVAFFSSLTYGLKQRQLRKEAILRLESYPRQLESYIDPSRSSCQLTQDGGTRPEDK